jgi:AcrR family transcriptional regulator
MRPAKSIDKWSAMRKPKDSERTRAEILAAATDEFAQHGLNGARLEAIAKRTRTTRAMIYYYFDNREGLYRAALEDAYRKIRTAESTLDLAHMAPIAAMRRLVEFVFDYYQHNQSFVALVVAENQCGGRHIRKVHKMRTFNVSIIDTLREVLDRGIVDGTFRRGLDAVDVHLAISALGFFQIANRHTFGYIFRRDFSNTKQVAAHRELVVEIVLSYLGAMSPDARRAQRRRATTIELVG